MTKELQNVTRDLKNRDIGKIVEFHVCLRWRKWNKRVLYRILIPKQNKIIISDDVEFMDDKELNLPPTMTCLQQQTQSYT